VELYGDSASGKTQVVPYTFLVITNIQTAFSVAVQAALRGNTVMFIETENSFSPQRLAEIATFQVFLIPIPPNQNSHPSDKHQQLHRSRERSVQGSICPVLHPARSRCVTITTCFGTKTTGTFLSFLLSLKFNISMSDK